LSDNKHDTVRIYDTIEEFYVDSKAECSALSSTRSQKKKLKQANAGDWSVSCFQKLWREMV